MQKQEFLDRITEIGTCEDDVTRRELLTALSDECANDYDTISSLTETNNNLLADNEKLRSANMQLFLRVGESKSKGEKLKDETGIDPEKEPKKFEDLFNEKGEIK